MEKKAGNLNSLQKEIQFSQLVLIISITILLSIGETFIYLHFHNKALNQELQNTAEVITRLYSFAKDLPEDDFKSYMDDVVNDLSNVDVISIVNLENCRVYHSHHELIGLEYEGTIPDFENHKSNFYTESNIGPSGPQIRTYSAVYGKAGNYEGFIMTIRLKTSISGITSRIIILFLIVTLTAIFVEITIAGVLSRRIKKEFLLFTEDFEGTKFLVDSMRANNHDFTNKLHVILGLIQIGQYDKAVSYIQNISIIQRENISRVMKAIENPSFAALIVGKIARASECNVKFTLAEGSCFKSADVSIPSEALVTITGNLIDNALDSMNQDVTKSDKELSLGVFTRPDELLIIVKDTGSGIPEEIQDKIFENGFSTKGEGRGIGLYHTKQLVTSLGGRISVESQVGIGTSFMINL